MANKYPEGTRVVVFGFAADDETVIKGVVVPQLNPTSACTYVESHDPNAPKVVYGYYNYRVKEDTDGIVQEIVSELGQELAFEDYREELIGKYS